MTTANLSSNKQDGSELGSHSSVLLRCCPPAHRLLKWWRTAVKRVVLNACYSVFQADALSQHVDYVIGMDQPLSDRAAIEFTIGFYDALFAGHSYKDAYNFGRNAIHLIGIPEHLTPVLHTKAG